MSEITILDQATINKIAAGEVVERPSAVVKELVENAIDAGANSITIEIKEGGIRFIRITDNGKGIAKEEIALAFKRHATSKIKSIEDLMTVDSLGFRGEALASISAVAQVELITKTKQAFLGCRYCIDGGEEKKLEEIGCPDGTTMIVRNLFYHTPARRKFLKTATTEGGYISDLIERLAISHPDISFKFLNNNQLKLHTSGNSNIKDIIYHIYGKDITAQLLSIDSKNSFLSVHGFIGKPIISRGNRNYMNYYINGRYIKSTLINKAIEEAYKPYSMMHRYPFTVLHFQIESSYIDVNVHPTKMEIRFTNKEEIYQFIFDTVSSALKERELIPEILLQEKKTPSKEPQKQNLSIPEPFEKKRREQQIEKTTTLSQLPFPSVVKEDTSYIPKAEEKTAPKQYNLFEENFLSKEAQKQHRIIGQIFQTYWIVEYEDKMFLIDQHAAHEKVLFEKTMSALKEKTMTSQMLQPPVILSLTSREETVLKKYLPQLQNLGFEIEEFGGKEYSVRAVPADLFGLAEIELLKELIDDFIEEELPKSPDMILEKVASLSCKAAVKGNHKMSFAEAKSLIDYLMTLENPYHCPHGRPVIVSMTKYELEKKFKRIL